MTTTGSEPAGGEITEPLRSRRNHWNNRVRRHARMIPGSTALSFAGVETSWRDLDRRTTALAAALHRRGIRFGDRVLILMLNRSEYVEVVLAANLIGVIAVPVNFRMSPAEVGFLADDCGACAIVTETALATTAAAVRASSDTVLHVVEVGTDAAATPVGADHLAYTNLLAEDPSDLPVIDIPEDTVALLMYTSGTTGRPKGAMLSHGNLLSQTVTGMRAMNTRSTDRSSCVAPMFHIAGIVGVAPAIYVGSVSVIHPLGAFSPDDLLDTLERERSTSVFLVPAQWQAVCAAQRDSPRSVSLRVASWGAAPASDTVLRAMAEAFPEAMIVALFGQTEMSPVTCLLEGADALRKIGSVGRVVESVEARVVDDAMNDVAPGGIGEIVYRGPGMMAGYWQNPQGTAEAFAGGWFHSGDLVRVDDEGFVYVVDRKKDMIISGGENIFCAEVENEIFAHPAVADVAVIGRAHEKWGEVPVAVVVLRPDAVAPDAAELSGFLNDRLARFKHPADVVVVDVLPRNAGGKVVKPVLRTAHGSRDAGLHRDTD